MIFPLVTKVSIDISHTPAKGNARGSSRFKMTAKQLDIFHDGVLSMAPMGAWLPWAEVVSMAAGHGWPAETCLDTAESLVSLRAMEFDPPRDPSQRHPVEPARVRLLYDKEIHGELGVVEVSSDEEVLSPLRAFVGARRWRAGALQPAAGVDVDLPLPQSLDLQDALLLPTFWALWSEHSLDSDSFGSPGISPDVPAWVPTLFSDPHFCWTTARVLAMSTALVAEFQAGSSGTDAGSDALQPSEPISNPSSSSSRAATPGLPRTKWGRCAYLVSNLSNCF